MHPSVFDDDDLARSGINPEEIESSFWINNAQRHLKGVLNSKPYETPKKAKNIILFLGDGMSLTTVAAARVFIGGEEKSLSFEKFPYFGLSKVMHLVQLLCSVCPHSIRYCFYCWVFIFHCFVCFPRIQTYCVNKQVADSACTSTAYLNGVKANYGTMGINAGVERGDCKGQNDKSAQTESIASWAQKGCKATGLVTTSRVTHASPGGLYARKRTKYF